MFLVFFILLAPEAGWRRAAASGQNWLRTLFLHLLPMLLLGCAAEAYGILHWGKKVGQFGGRQTYPLDQALRLEACHLVAGLIIALICACILRKLADTFQRRQKYSQALVVSVFALGPVMLARIADAFPVINPWLSWGVGALLAVALLYQGLPRVLNLDPAHALGVYVSASLLLVLVTGLNRLLMVMLVQPRLLVGAGG